MTKEEKKQAQLEREEMLRNEPLKAFKLTKEELEQLKKEGRI